MVIAADDFSRTKFQRGGAQCVAGDPGAGNFPCGADGREVLAQQARLGASGANVVETERRAREAGESQRGAEDLATAFTGAAVEDERFHGKEKRIADENCGGRVVLFGM